MMRYFLITLFLLFSLEAREVSSFGAGSLDSDNPYGLSESEKIIFENKKQIRAQNRQISDLTQQLEGVRSVVESMGSKIGKTTQRLNELNNQTSSDDLEDVRADIGELKRVQSENYEKINAVLKKLSSMIDEIDSNYVTSDELKSTSVKKKPTNQNRPTKLSSGDKLKKAVALYRKKYYTKAFPIFVELSERSYKPATTNYYLGEISYYKKRYSDAIVYYKKSVGYYDKASFMPTLLLHTGISFYKLDDDENKEKFLQALLSSYPNSNEAKIAEKYLN